MYLKRLEIQGFKSFASATTFELGRGVTCVVGPNGSGKTNVAEAIRWVLGEQVSKVIRARRTEDVIFSGSSLRSALGMADVRLTLDNSDHWLPIDFSEVVVSRRAYRNGDNEYYINQSRVRLKDVTELFLKAEVGQNSYAFMGQGLVEQVLTLRAEERRSLVEEAAEVRLHRDKLDEARNRLGATRDNLERVNMLIGELEPRLRQLERQANRAASHARLSTELAQSLVSLFGEQWREAQEALSAARATSDQREQEFDSARQQLKAYEEGLASLESAVEERRADIAGRDEAYRQGEDYRHDLERRITIDTERARMLGERRRELDGELEVLRRDQEALAPTVQQLSAKLARATDDIGAARRPDARTRELDAAEAEIAALRRTLSKTEKDAARDRVRLGEAEARLSTLEDERKRLARQATSLQKTRQQHIKELKSWARAFAKRRQRRLELAPLASVSAHAAEGAKERLDEAERSLARSEDELHSLDLEIRAVDAQLNAASATGVELPAPDAGIHAVMGATSEDGTPRDRVQGLIGMVGTLIQVPQGLERAIEAALGDSLHTIVVEAEEDALAAIELLVSEDVGRATVLPLNDLNPINPVRMLEERGVVGNAAELVRCEPRYRPLVDSLLGRTLVAENLGVAKMLLRRGLGSVVTRDGVLLRPIGSMTAGSVQPIREALSHQREIGGLPGELERLQSARSKAEDAIEEAKTVVANAKLEHDQRSPESEKLGAQLADAEESLRSHRGRLGSVAAPLPPLHGRLRDGTLADSEAEDALAATGEIIETITTAIDEHDTELERLRRDLGDQDAAREVLARGAADRTAKIAGLERDVGTFTEQLDLQSSTLERVERELARRGQLSESAAEELTAVQGRLQSARTELEEKSREAAAAREELEPARNSLEQLESRRRTISDDLVTARARAIETERAKLETQTTVRLRTEELGALRERLAEEGFRPSAEGDIVSVEGDQPLPAWLAADPPTPQEEEPPPPPVTGGSDIDPVALKERIAEIRAGIRKLGPVNEQAEGDYAETHERHGFLSGQVGDLNDAENSLQGAIRELEQIIKERFSETFEKVNEAFRRYFESFFGGGHAELQLTEPDEYGMPGIDIIAQPPRKKVRTINMLSGGERSLTAVALLFALLDVHPSPVCVLDEVDAALDEANVGRFATALQALVERTQFIIITHNRRTIEMAHTIYGVSMGEDSASSVLSLRMSDIPATA